MDSRPEVTAALLALDTAGLRRPSTLTLVLTEGCNLACGHCWVESPFFNTVPPVPAGDLCRVAAEFVELGGTTLNLTGGEALTHPEWATVLRFAAALAGLRTICFQTNAALPACSIGTTPIPSSAAAWTSAARWWPSLGSPAATTRGRARASSPTTSTWAPAVFSPCHLFPVERFAARDVYERSLAEAIREAVPMWAEAQALSCGRASQIAACVECPGEAHCAGGCMGRAWLTHGGPEEPEDRCGLRRAVYGWGGGRVTPLVVGMIFEGGAVVAADNP